MIASLRFVFFNVFARLVTAVVLGLNVRHAERLPTDGPAILVANHNSHLDTMVLVNLLPAGLLPKIRPVAAADYFLANRWIAWFATRVIGIVAIERGGAGEAGADPLAPLDAALDAGEILVFFPEGTRGEPEQRSALRAGVARLAERHPEVPVVPVFLHGLGKALPKGEAVLVPFFCDVFVGEPLRAGDAPRDFLAAVDGTMRALEAEGHFPSWS